MQCSVEEEPLPRRPPDSCTRHNRFGRLPGMAIQRKNSGFLFHLFDVALNIVVIVGIVVGIRTFLISPFQVEGSSMTSTLEDKEYIIINKLVYYIGEPKRGDIIVFYPPHEDHERYYVKRVIGLPGDEITLRSGNVYIREAGSDEEHLLQESYLDEQNAGKTFPQPHGGDSDRAVSYIVPSQHYFVLGDNRQGSLDSRSFASKRDMPLPYVPEENIKGRVWLVALPITKIHALEAPQYDL